MRGPLGVVALALFGCGGAAGLVLKSPIVSKCQDAALHGCVDLADGVIDYLSGDKAAGASKIKKGAAANEPDGVREFADKIRLLKAIPGASQYTGPLVEVADLLASAPAGGSVGASTSSYGMLGSSEGRPAAAPSGATALAGSVVPAAEGAVCVVGSDGDIEMPVGDALCTALTPGPVVVHDVETIAACPNTLIVGAGKPASPRWMLVALPGAPLHVHGAALSVRAGERFFAVQLARTKPEFRKDLPCLVTWSATR